VNYIEYEESVEKRARELTHGFPPEYNMAPLMQLIRDADRLGYKVVTGNDGVSLNSARHPDEFAIKRMADAIKDGRLSLTRKGPKRTEPK